mmetsp:Transcript_25617/g.31074  ORF Transcript_25617/g.31074 Transcript_25617/m.31074 type:complete len:292 (+) Transcript_25617:136-1011(+)|eukprot:CAMPEP_0197866036 /NCGR_PEP_ID=MMETSP1438-20131217/43995_1 /TAXON_ID=1461541 /ORGANISM="Pterosperma sp., Strain CCMP1384" /LENGTH=291 /DNA_ID=CAMNT_0043484567 /DNA_START=126 /DNA_END=1001 /DNA_ORIENTATION=+
MDRDEVSAMWNKEFENAREAESWGQIEEAKEGYDRLASKVKQVHDDNGFRHSAEEKAILLKLVNALNIHSKEVMYDQELGVGARGIAAISKFMPKVLVQYNPPPSFPINMPQSAVNSVVETTAPVPTAEVEGGSLLPPPTLRLRGDEALSITVEKMGFKDATEFIDPFISVTVVDARGEMIEAQQDTPPSNRNKPNYLLFGNEIHIQTPLNQLRRGTAILFELKHFKPKKKKISTKAWAFMEDEEFQNAHGKQLSLEIYKKPSDFRRKKKNLQLLSVKPLYLHVDIAVRVF